MNVVVYVYIPVVSYGGDAIEMRTVVGHCSGLGVMATEKSGGNDRCYGCECVSRYGTGCEVSNPKKAKDIMLHSAVF